MIQKGVYASSTNYLIVDNDGTDPVLGRFARIENDLVFFDPSVSYNAGTGNDVVLTLKRNADFVGVAETHNQRAVAGVLQRLPGDDPLFLTVLFQTLDGARQAYDALSGEIYATTLGVVADQSRYVREAVIDRLIQADATSQGRIAALGTSGPQLASLDSGAMTLGPAASGVQGYAPPPSLVFWTRAYGAWGRFDGERNAATASRDLGGFLSGMDARFGGDWRLGVATGLSQSNIDVDTRASHADVD